MKNKIIIAILLLGVSTITFAQTNVPESFFEYQNAVYSEITSSEEMNSLFDKALSDIKSNTNYSDAEKGGAIALLYESRTRQFLFEEKDYDDIKEFIEEGIEIAEESIDIEPTKEAHAALAGLLSQMTNVDSSTMLSAGTKIKGQVKDSLKIDEDYPLAGQLLASTMIYAPKMFRNLNKGIETAEEYLELAIKNNTASKVDLYNLNLCIAHAYYLKKDYDIGDQWYEKAEEFFPHNKMVLERGTF